MDLVGYSLGYLTVDRPDVKQLVVAPSAHDPNDAAASGATWRSQVLRRDAFETVPVRLELTGSIISQTCATPPEPC